MGSTEEQRKDREQARLPLKEGGVAGRPDISDDTPSDQRNWLKRLWHFGYEKLPFAATGLIATSINYGLYLLLVDRYLPPVPATVIAYSSSVVLNFFMQRYFVFELRRSLGSAFVLSMLVSVGGLALDAAIVWLLHLFPVFGDSEWLIKLVATGVVFFYNFYGKRKVFEG